MKAFAVCYPETLEGDTSGGWRASEFNERLRSKEVAKEITIQRTCRTARDENEVGKLMDQIWDHPSMAPEVSAEAVQKNVDVSDLEEELGS